MTSTDHLVLVVDDDPRVRDSSIGGVSKVR